MFHARGQGHVVQQIVVDVQRLQRNQSRRQVEVGERIVATDYERGQIRQAIGKGNVGESVEAEVEKGQTREVRREAETEEQVVGQVKTAQSARPDRKRAVGQGI